MDVHGARRKVMPKPNNLNKRFEARWLLEEDCEKVVVEACDEVVTKGNGKAMEHTSKNSHKLLTNGVEKC